jgi:DNA-binding GntR family transcriptional regulator
MPTFDRAPSLTITDYLVKVIGLKILSGELKPGERLHETVIAQEVGVSRGPIREAVRRLQEQRLLMYAPNRGVWVTEFSSNDLEPAMFMHNSRWQDSCSAEDHFGGTVPRSHLI